MRLYLVQHGEAKSEKEDPERSLTDRGAGRDPGGGRSRQSGRIKTSPDVPQRQASGAADGRPISGGLVMPFRRGGRP